jgi:hypothetical protein
VSVRPDPTARIDGGGWIGRAAELELFRDALAVARTGRGSAWALVGEAGVGKSELTTRIGELATEQGFALAWGRSVETGGAPPLWPWTEVLRALELQGSAVTVPTSHESLHASVVGRASPRIDERTRRQLAPLLPELDGEDAPSSMGPAEARFRLLDAVVRTLAACARARPLLVVIEDLSAADLASVELLELAAGATRNVPLLLLATWRDVDEPGALRAVRRVRLDRFGRDEVAAALGPAWRAWLEPVMRATEGHPLHLGEVLRGLARGELRIEDRALVGVPSSIGAALRVRLDRLSPETCEVVRAASVLGRDVDTTRVARLLAREVRDVESALGEAVEASILARFGDRWRFRHVLWREAVLAACEPARRLDWHRRAAAQLREQAPVRWSEVAHHLFAASEAPDDARPGSRLAVEASDELAHAAEQAAHDSAKRLAYDDAARWWERAVDATRDETVRAHRLVALADATLRAGDLSRGRAFAAQAARTARELGDPRLLARAALAYGAEIVAAEVDATLVALLEEARAALGDSDASLSALVLARLAGALQPASDPNVPFALAREAIARARTLGDEGLLLQTFRSANAALVDLAPPDERLASDLEHATLAARLDDPVEAHRAWRRLHFDARELGDVGLARRAKAEVSALGERLAIPHFGWYAHALDALDAAHRGDRSEAARAHEQASELAEAARSDSARATLAYQGVLMRLRFADLDAAEAALRRVAPTSDFASDFVRLLEVSAAARRRLLLGGEPRTFVGSEAWVARWLSMGDRSELHLFAELAFASADASLARVVEDALRPFAAWNVSFGLFGMYVGGPVARDLALLAWTRGALDEAWTWNERAMNAAEAAEARVEGAWIALERARLAEAMGRADAASLRDRARQRADALGLDALSAAMRASSNVRTSDRPRDAATTWAFEREGEAWRVSRAGASFLLADTKGARWLARLVASPGHELHVLDLASDFGVAAPGSRSDAGAVLDAEARRAYAARARALRERLAEAEDRDDLGAIERARGELDALERELRAALGLGGRERRAGAAVEKARVNVQRRLKDALRRIAEYDAELGKHLERSVRTGTLCVYDPDGWSVIVG